jgi:hypothetical protein
MATNRSSGGAGSGRGGDEPGTQLPSEKPSSPADDLAELRIFVHHQVWLLQAIVDDERYIPPELLDDVRMAWDSARRDLEHLAERLSPGDNNYPFSQLEKHGLTGAPLRMKMRAWRSRFFGFGRRMNRRWLRSVLRWSDTILSSLVDAMTLGAAGKEFKEAIENFIEDCDTRT